MEYITLFYLKLAFPCDLVSVEYLLEWLKPKIME